MKIEYLKWNLEQALQKPERLILSDGQKPVEWHYFKTSGNLHLIMPNGDIRIYGAINGQYNSPYNTTGLLQCLMLLPDIQTVWVNVYFDGERIYLLRNENVYESKELAVKNTASYYLKTIPITNEPE